MRIFIGLVERWAARQRGLTLGGILLLAGLIAGASVAHAASTPDFTALDEAAARANACEDRVHSTIAADPSDSEAILAALNEQGKCLEVVLFSVARDFYDTDAFGAGGVEARITELRDYLGRLYGIIYSEPRTCTPNCGEIYQIWAAEAYVTSIRILLDDMLARLREERPIAQ